MNGWVKSRAAKSLSEPVSPSFEPPSTLPLKAPAW